MPLDEDSSEKWRRVQARLRATLGEDAYTAWFSRLQLEDILAPRVYFSVPTTFLKSWIEKHYLKELTSCTAREFPETQKVVILQRVAGKPVIIPGRSNAEEDEDPSSPVLKQENTAPPAPVTEEPFVDTEEMLPKPGPDGKIKLAMVIHHACFRFKLRRVEYLAKGRRSEIVLPRQIGMFLSFYMTGHSLPEIGRRFGGRDHATVLHSMRKVQKLILEDIAFAFDVASLEAKIRNRPLLA